MKIKLLLCLFICVRTVIAQETKPGKSTEDLSGFKAQTSVDFATGILNYNVPLFNASYDGLSIPITLSYNAGGIKNKQRPGLAGVGWTLSYGGGTIGRTLRGFCADENKETGILDNPIPSGGIGNPIYDQHLEKVNSSKLDGESDIFALNIQGSNVKFILVKIDGNIQVKPLEKTDISILPTFSPWTTREILGWTVKDGSGNTYEFIPAKPSSININGNAPGTNYGAYVTMSWYLSRIVTFDHKEVKFVYSEYEFPDDESQAGGVIVNYNPAFKVPNLRDPALIAQLQSYADATNSASALIANINEQIDVLKRNAYQAGRTFAASQYSDGPGINRMNRSVVENYNAMINTYNRALTYLPISIPNPSLIQLVLQQMAAPVDQEEDYIPNVKGSLLISKVIKKIILPTGEISFSYKASDDTVPFDMYSKIEYKSKTGEPLETIKLSMPRYGLLKDISWFNSNNSVKKILNFDYYYETNQTANSSMTFGSNYADDYWGYYNGKLTNKNLYPRNAGYMTAVLGTPIGYASVFMGGVSDKPVAADRNPDINFAVARTLKSVTTQSGAITTFTYENNEIYAADIERNITIGGLRIKDVTINDGQKNLVTSYKYAFPQSSSVTPLKSSGRLNEWQKKMFNWTYFFSSGGRDMYSYENFAYRGSLYDDASNNGVLYHYVEEIHPDNSVTGYKFPEVYPGYYLFNGNPDQYHNTQLDRALIAKIQYNANGKIVQIDRKKYTYPLQYLGNRTTEFNKIKTAFNYFEDTGSVLPGIWKQIKKEPIHFNHAAMLESFPNQASANHTISFGGQSVSINPYNSYYLPNYPQRENHEQLATFYELYTETALLLKEEESLLFQDYDLTAFNSSAPNSLLENERPYLFDKLMRYTAAKRLSSLNSYTYNTINHVYVTSLSKRDSKNNTTVYKTKYIIDYNLASGHPITAMKEAHRYNQPVESQTWKSVNSSTFKFAGGEITEFQLKTADGKNYVFPEKKYKSSQAALIEPVSLGYAEQLQSTGPYNNQFWESKNLYKLEESYKWEVKNNLGKLAELDNKLGVPNVAYKYDEFNGNTIIEVNNTKSDQILAVDFSPYLSNYYYSSRYNKFNRDRFNYIDSTLNILALTNRGYSWLVFSTALDNSLDHYKLCVEAKNILDGLQNLPSYYQLLESPIFNDFLTIFNAIAEGKSTEILEAGMVRFRYDFMQGYYFGSEYGNLTAKFTQLGIDVHALTFIVNNMIRTLKSEYYSKRPNYLDMTSAETAFSKHISIPEKLRRPYELKIDAEMLDYRYLNLYLLPKIDAYPASGATAYLTVVYTDGTSSTETPISTNASKRVQKRSIDLHSFSNYQNIRALKFTFNSICPAYFAVVPAAKQFKASAYLPDSRQYIRFDQNLRLTENFYDAKGDHHFTKNEDSEILAMETKILASEQLPTQKMVKVNITNSYQQFAFVQPITPKIISFTFRNVNTNRIYDFPVNIFPAQFKAIELPAGPYQMILLTEAGTYSLKVNNVPISVSSTGISQFGGTVVDATNLNEFDIDLY